MQAFGEEIHLYPIVKYARLLVLRPREMDELFRLGQLVADDAVEFCTGLLFDLDSGGGEALLVPESGAYSGLHNNLFSNRSLVGGHKAYIKHKRRKPPNRRGEGEPGRGHGYSGVIWLRCVFRQSLFGVRQDPKTL